MHKNIKFQKRQTLLAMVVMIALFLALFTGFVRDKGLKEPFHREMAAGHLDLTGWHPKVHHDVTLDGPWALYWQQLLTPKDFKGQSPLEPETYTTIPFLWDGRYDEDLGDERTAHSYATLRATIKTDAKEVGLYIPAMLTASKVWVNGTLVAKSGRPAKDYAHYEPLEKTVVAHIEDTEGTLDIVVQVANHHLATGGISKAMVLGDYDTFLRDSNLGVILEAVMAGVLFFMCAYHLIQYQLNMADKAPLFFALFCLGFVLRSGVSGHKLIQWVMPQIPWIVIVRLAYLTFVPIIFFSWYLQKVFPEDSNRRFVVLASYLWAIYALMVLIFPQRWASGVMYVGEAMVLGMAVYLLRVLTSAVRHGRKDVWPVLMGVGVMLVTIINDILFSLRILNSVELAVQGTVVFLLSQSYVISARFNRALKASVYYAEEADRTNEALRRLNRDLEGTVARRTEDVRRLLDNAGQGFLSFGRDMVVKADYSHECRRIFDGPIGGRSILSVMEGCVDTKAYQVMASALTKALNTSISYEQKLYLSLMPEVLTIGQHFYSLEAKVLQSEDARDVMMILTDITKSKALEQSRDEERKNLKMVVFAATHPRDVVREIEKFENHFLSSFQDKAATSMSAEAVMAQLYRAIHTYKGIFAQYGMFRTEKNLHELETALAPMKEAGQTLTKTTLWSVLEGIKPKACIEADKQVLLEILGQGFLGEGGAVAVPEASLVAIEKRLQHIEPRATALALTRQLKRLRYQALKDMLTAYDDYAQSMAQSLGKSVRPMAISGDDLYVDRHIFRELGRTLVHIVKNTVVHGLESPDDREWLGKETWGHIGGHITRQEGDGLCLTIANDGAALEAQHIADKAVARGLFAKEDIDNMTEEAIYNSVFMDGYTSREGADALSGRGVGLMAVREAVENLGGTITIANGADTGVVFTITLPFREGMIWWSADEV